MRRAAILALAGALLSPALVMAQGPSLPPSPPALTSVAITPRSTSLLGGSSQQFSATAAWSDGLIRPVTVRWTAQGGPVSRTGVYKAGSTAGSFRVIASLESKADTATVTVTSPVSGAPAVVRGSLIYDAHFESGTWPRGTVFDTCDSPAKVARVRVYSNADRPPGAPPARMGRHAVAVTVLESDVAPCTPTGNPRAAAHIGDLFKPGDTVWEAFSVYVPDDLPSVPRFMLFQQDYGFPFHGPPPNGFYIQDLTGAGNRFYINGNYDPVAKQGTRVWEGPLTTGVWHDWLVHKKLTTDASGFLEVWLDGHPLTFTNCSTRLGGQHTMLAGAESARFYLMQYRRAGMFPVDRYPGGLTLYFDDARIGTSREIVEQGR